LSPGDNGKINCLSQWGPLESRMKRQYVAVVLIFSAILVLVTTYSLLKKPAAMTTPVYGYRIVNTYPHDSNAFTEGLVYSDGFLYEGTGLNGHSTLRQVEFQTGTVLQSISLPEKYFGEGITIVGDRIYQLTYRSEIGFIYDRTSFSLLGNFTYSTEGWGLTYDGSRLIMSDGSSTLYFLDPSTLENVGQVKVTDGTPVTNLNELEYVNGKVYANVFLTNTIAVIDPSTGRVDSWIDLTGLPGGSHQDINSVLNGIAYESVGGQLFVTGKNWSNLYEIKLVTED
jgi:glutaminyl-peptide cyclotransferase